MDKLLNQVLHEMERLRQGQEAILNRLLLLENRTINSLSHLENEMSRLHKGLDAVSEQTAELLEFKTASIKKINITENKRLKTV